jgi:glutathione synthase/RimK-type ligase-like ATP-grasp enzyme
MIVAIGLDIDDTFMRFAIRAIEFDVPIEVVNLRAAVEGDWRFELPPRRPALLRHAEREIELRPDDAIFCRPIDLSSHSKDARLARRWNALTLALQHWLDAATGVVVNRPFGGWHNSSKPLHESILRDLGFRVPESITSCDVDALRRFVREAPAISKTICGTRSDTETATEADFENFNPLSGPVHLQRFVAGADARIHVVGNELVAQRVGASAVDYRRGEKMDDMETYEVPEDLRRLLVKATRSIGLDFAGWDFKIDDEGVYWCLEANSMPGYGPYDAYSNGAISRALFRHLGASLPAG